MPFRFKQFNIEDDKSSMKVGTDAVLLGAWKDTSSFKHILDLGTGCGLIAIMLAQRSNALVTGVDMHAESVAQAKENGAQCRWSDRLKFVHQTIQEFNQKTKERFDLVVSNPPFFENALKSPSSTKNISKHNDALPFTELIEASHNLATDQGVFRIILPADVADGFIVMARNRGWFLVDRLDIFPTPSKKINRCMMEFTRNTNSQININSLVIRNKDGSFTPEYKSFTKDFYLNF
jgi:tRNA1Val (adenine37-N6)-methyltransferase